MENIDIEIMWDSSFQKKIFRIIYKLIITLFLVLIIKRNNY